MSAPVQRSVQEIAREAALQLVPVQVNDIYFKRRAEVETAILHAIAEAVIGRVRADGSYCPTDGYLSAIIEHHHAAAQAETVALLERAAAEIMLAAEAYRRAGYPNTAPLLEQFSTDIRTHLAQLKEGAP